MTIADALAAVAATESNQPQLFRLSDTYYVKVDNQALPVYGAGCFGEAVEFLLKLFHVFQLQYPYQLKPVYGFFEHLMQLPISIGRSAALSDFVRRL